MADAGWKRLLQGWPWFGGAGSFPVLPNSEFMPPARLVRRPYGTLDTVALADDDPWGWPITEYDEALVLRPGLLDIARHIVAHLVPLCRGDTSHGIAQHKLRDNPYWPDELARRSHALSHERFVLLLPLALGLTQDDQGRVRWTLFGNSEQGPAHAFWRGFFTAPGREAPAEQGLAFFRELLSAAYDEPAERLDDLRAAGFRVLPDGDTPSPFPSDELLPSWTEPLRLADGESLRGVRFLLTFRPFRYLPSAVKRRYLAGDLHLLPCPAGLLFWGVDSYNRLGKRLRFGAQVPLLHFIERHEAPGKIRVPQSGWFNEAGPNTPPEAEHVHGPLRETYKRTYRQARVHRYEDSLVFAREHALTHTLFSTRPHDVDLYHKPAARNVQLWTHRFEPLLDGPNATTDDLRRAAQVVAQGGLFGYRFVFPTARVGHYALYWHRPLAAYAHGATRRPRLFERAPLGYFTAYHDDRTDRGDPVEMWPRPLAREPHVENIALFSGLKEDPPHRTMTNVHKLLDAWERRGRRPVPASLARQLLTVPKRQTLEGWLRGLPHQARSAERARGLVARLRGCIAPDPPAGPRRREVPPALTFAHTANRAFEEAYWNTIARLSAGEYVNKNNGDCVLDRPTQAALQHHWRDLEPLGESLLAHYARLVAEHGMADAVRIGELPFQWQTQYPFPWMGGWLHNQDGTTHERNLIVMIPGRDRRRAVLMADHYDTAYMYDRYERGQGGTGARLSAPGADDNCSATATLMLGAPALFELSRQGRLACDVWLVHLTGEEYPAEGQGACRMCQWLVEGTLAMRTVDGKRHDLSDVRVQGLYVLDMVAHNNPKDRDVFQISPGVCPEALWLAEQAHQANRTWNLSTEVWNRAAARRRAGRGRRSRDGTLPPICRFLPLHGEVRPHFDPRSTLYNTDGQLFSDVGVPVSLFMENYDINRTGYHDSHDNMTNISLDYGAALAAIAIESVARAATEPPP